MTDRCYFLYSNLVAMGSNAWGWLDGNMRLKEDFVKDYWLKVLNTGVNATRILLYNAWVTEKHLMLTPFKYLSNISAASDPLAEPTDTNDSGKWDLSVLNEDYFIELHKLVEILSGRAFDSNGKECLVTIDALDHCQMFPGSISPYMAQYNINGVSDIYEKSAIMFTCRVVEKILDTLEGLPFRINVGNELKIKKSTQGSSQLQPLFELLHNRGHLPFSYGSTFNSDPKDGLTYMGTQQMNVEKLWGEEDKFMVWRPCHDCLDFDDDPLKLMAEWWFNYPAIKVIMSDDGVSNGDSQCDTDGKRYRPSPYQWYNMIQYVGLKYGNKITSPTKGVRFAFEHLPKNNAWECQKLTLTLMSTAIKTYIGALENENSFTLPVAPEPEPEPEPTPEPQPEPEIKLTFWQKIWAWIKKLFGGK